MFKLSNLPIEYGTEYGTLQVMNNGDARKNAKHPINRPEDDMTFDEWFRAIVIIAKEHGALNLLREQEEYRPGYNEGLSPEQEVQIVIKNASA